MCEGETIHTHTHVDTHIHAHIHTHIIEEGKPRVKEKQNKKGAFVDKCRDTHTHTHIHTHTHTNTGSRFTRSSPSSFMK